MLAIPVALIDLLVVLLIITAIVFTWYLLVPLETRARQFGALGNWIGDRTADIRNATYTAAKAIIDGSITLIISGLRLFTQFMHDVARDVSNILAAATQQIFNEIQWTFVHIVTPAIDELHALHAGVTWWIQTQIIPAIARISNLEGLINWTTTTLILPAVADIKALGNLLRYVNSIEIPAILQITKSIQDYIAWLESHVIKPVRADVDWIISVIPGILGRIGRIEGILAGILPLIGAIGLTIPLARVLGRVARNPCTCLEDNGGQTDMLPLLMYLFEEAG